MCDATDRRILDLSAQEATAEIADGRVTAARYVAAALRRIEVSEPILKAWAFVDPERALSEASERDAAPARGPLQGVPVGVKDVIDTYDMPTAHNSPLYVGYQPAADAPCVEMLRQAGAVIVGKTETTEFAAGGRFPRTRNPFDPRRTAGGSSAGSAAAVADRQIPLAIGTQTGGSTLRPASFCGVHAFKPTWGAVSREGVKLFAASFDTVTWFARGIGDLELLADVYGIESPVAPPQSVVGLRIALCRTPQWSAVEAPMRSAFEAARKALAAAGVETFEIDLPSSFARLGRVHDTIALREGAAAFRNLSSREALHEDFRRIVENRAGQRADDLREAYDLAASSRHEFDRIASDYDAVLAPSAPGEAPEGPGPGSHVVNQLWSLLQTPCVNLPRWASSAGLPLGMTLTTRRFDDRRLLAIASAVDRLFSGSKAKPEFHARE